MSTAGMSASGTLPVPRPIRLGLTLLLATAAVAHLARPRWFEPMVPGWVPGTARGWNLGSAAMEAGSAVLLATPRTRRWGGAAAFVTFATVGVANVQAAIDDGYAQLPAPFDTRAVAVARLPLQLPLLAWSWRLARTPYPAA